MVNFILHGVINVTTDPQVVRGGPIHVPYMLFLNIIYPNFPVRAWIWENK